MSPMYTDLTSPLYPVTFNGSIVFWMAPTVSSYCWLTGAVDSERIVSDDALLSPGATVTMACATCAAVVDTDVRSASLAEWLRSLTAIAASATASSPNTTAAATAMRRGAFDAVRGSGESSIRASSSSGSTDSTGSSASTV